MAQTTTERVELYHDVHLSEEEFQTLKQGSGVVVSLDDPMDDYHMSSHPMVVIHPTLAKNTDKAELSGIETWFGPSVKRGESIETTLDNGDRLSVHMPDA